MTIGNSVESIGNSAFEDCKKLIEVKNLSSLNITAGSEDNGYVGYYAKRIYTEGNSYLSAENDYIIYDDGTDIILVDYTGTEADLTLPEGITKINDYAFNDYKRLTSVTIPNSVTSIGDDAFYNCYHLIEVKNLSSLKIEADTSENGRVGLYAKRIYSEGDSYLSAENDYIIYNDGTDKIIVCYTGTATELTLPEDITQIYSHAFAHCDNLTSVTIPDSVTSIGESAFYDCNSLTSVSIGNGVKSIGYEAFCNCTGLTSVTIPDSVKSIGNYAFYNCTGLTSIVIPDSVKSIGECAFYGCSRLASVTIGNGVTSIGNYAFAYCNSLTSVTIPDGITNINNYTFAFCYGLKSAVIPDSVTNIGNYAFAYDDNLTSVIIGNGVKSIGHDAFCGCSNLTSIVIPDSVESILSYAFNNCTNLTSITIGNSVKSIDYEAFSGCTNLTSVYYNGTADKWSEISISSYNSPLTEATRYYYSENVPTSNTEGTDFDGNFWRYVDGEIAVWNYAEHTHTWSDNICTACHYDAGGSKGLNMVLDTVTNTYSLNGIGTCTDTELVIPSTYNGLPVTSISNYAFYSCEKLTGVTIGNSVESIGESAFEDCKKLIEVKNLSSTLTIETSSTDNGYVGYYAKRIYTEGNSYLSTERV